MMAASLKKHLRLFKPAGRWRPRMETVLFATDLSTSSREGLDWAAWLARCAGARLLIVYVEEPLKQGEERLYEGLPGSRDTTRARLRSFVPADSTVPYAHRVLAGEPAAEIVRLARRERPGLIILGTHCRTGVRRLLKGSVAEAVLRRAGCPVFAVPQAGESAAIRPPAGSA